jgi:thiol-disulfide isomerase/thioredoxin
MKKTMLLLSYMVLFLNLRAQQLNIGDKLPDTILDTIINYPSSTAKLSDFTGRPTIISFWSQYCTTCMSTFKKLDSLQLAFGRGVNFLAINSENAAPLKKLFKENNILKKIKIPSVVSDTLLHSWFPHRTIPHIAWIDRDGRIAAITSSKELKDENLKKLANGNRLSLETKYEEEDVRKFRVQDPLLLNDYDNNKEKMLEYSYLSEYRKGIIATAGIIRRGNYYQTICTNQSVENLYKVAYNKSTLHQSLVFFDSAHKFIPDPKTKQNLFCYDAFTKKKDPDAIRKKMQFVLDVYFNLHSSIELRQAKYYALQVVDSFLLRQPLAAGDGIENAEQKQGLARRKINLKALTETYLSHLSLQVVNESSLKGFFEIALPADKTDLKLIQECLRVKGMVLVEKTGPLECLVIRAR